jgi:dCMP deaminase
MLELMIDDIVVPEDATHYGKRYSDDDKFRFYKDIKPTGGYKYRDMDTNIWITKNSGYPVLDIHSLIREEEFLPDEPEFSLEEDVFMEMTYNLARLSKCVSMDVAAIAVDESGRVVATGVNGSASGHDNCCDIFSEAGPEHSAWSLDYEIHAEMNMILDLARTGKTFSKAKIYSTHSPCQNCLKHLIGLQLKDKVVITDIIFGSKYYKVADEYLENQIGYAAQFNVNLRKHVTKSNQ